MLKYCFWRNFFSRAESCCVVNGVRGLRLGLCFLRVPILMGPVGGLRVRSGKQKMKQMKIEKLTKISHLKTCVFRVLSGNRVL